MPHDARRLTPYLSRANTAMNQPPTLSLTPAGVLSDIAAAIVRHWKSLVIVSVPGILVVIWSALVNLSLRIDTGIAIGGPPLLWMLLNGLLYFLVSTMWIVSIARIILLNDTRRAEWLGIRWQRREWWVLLETILVGLASALLIIPLFIALLIAAKISELDVSTFGLDPALGYWPNLAASLVVSAIVAVGIGRWGFAIVASAVDSNVRMGESWRVTAGNTLAIAGTLFLLLIPSAALQTFIDLKPTGSPVFFIVSIVGVPVYFAWQIAVQAFVLCAAYRRLAPYLRGFDGQPHQAAQTFPT